MVIPVSRDDGTIRESRWWRQWQRSLVTSGGCSVRGGGSGGGVGAVEVVVVLARWMVMTRGMFM